MGARGTTVAEHAMGWVRQCERQLTDAEHDLLRRSKRGPTPRPLDAAALRSARAIEFDIGIDRITKPPSPGLSEPTQLYVLEIGTGLAIGFEQCFLEGSVVTGAFPSNRVRVSFAVRPRDGGGWEDATPERCAVSFDWCGLPVEVIEVGQHPPWDQVAAIYRLSDMQELAATFESRR